MTYRLILLRHGQSTWNLENLFTGWTDVGADRPGRGGSPRGGAADCQRGARPGILHTSVLVRAIKTAELTLEEMGVSAGASILAPQRASLRSPARPDKKETADQHGADQVLMWRRSYDVPLHRSTSLTSVTPVTTGATATWLRISYPPNA